MRRRRKRKRGRRRRGRRRKRRRRRRRMRGEEEEKNEEKKEEMVGLVIALRPQTLKHIRGSHYTDTSEPVDGNGTQNMVTVQSGYRTSNFSITGPTSLPTPLTGPPKKKG
jgi:hypothetical protein